MSHAVSRWPSLEKDKQKAELCARIQNRRNETEIFLLLPSVAILNPSNRSRLPHRDFPSRRLVCVFLFAHWRIHTHLVVVWRFLLVLLPLLFFRLGSLLSLFFNPSQQKHIMKTQRKFGEFSFFFFFFTLVVVIDGVCIAHKLLTKAISLSRSCNSLFFRFSLKKCWENKICTTKKREILCAGWSTRFILFVIFSSLFKPYVRLVN